MYVALKFPPLGGVRRVCGQRQVGVYMSDRSFACSINPYLPFPKEGIAHTLAFFNLLSQGI
jgi:hypothetical protein